jgi:hypothetical protein
VGVVRGAVDSPGYQCCFCGKSVSAGAAAAHPLDPCAVRLIGNWSTPESQQLTQQFWCQIDCFKRRITDPRNIYIEDMTPGDQA